MLIRFTLLLLLAEVYTLVRYHVLKGLPLAQWPFFLNNKALSLTALLLIAWSLVPSQRAGRQGQRLRATMGRVGLGLALVHGALSLVLLHPLNYPGFFNFARALNPKGQLSLGLGVASMGCLIASAVLFRNGRAAPELNRSRVHPSALVRCGLAAAAGHVATMGFQGWMKPASWPGGMPPITLLAFLATLSPLAAELSLRALRRRAALPTATPPRPEPVLA